MKLSISCLFLLTNPFGGTMAGEITDQILVAINKDRALNDLPILKLNSALSRSALAKADDMIAKNYFAHHSPDGKKPWDWVNRAEYPYIFVGENLAMNFTTSESVHNALMLSPTHKKNILGDKYTDVGLAVVAGEINGKSTNVLVQMFGARKDVVVAKAKPEVVAPVVNEAVQKPKSEVTILGIQNTPKKPIAIKPVAVKPVVKKPTAIATTKPVVKKVFAKAPTPLPVVNDDSKIVKSAATKDVAPQIATSVAPNLAVPETASTTASTTATSSLEVASSSPVGSTAETNDSDSCVDCVQIREADNQIPPVLLNNKPVTINVETQSDNKYSFLSKFANFVYVFFLIFMSVALMLKIFINISIQHKSVIVQTVLLLIFIVGLINVDFNFLDYVNSILIM